MTISIAHGEAGRGATGEAIEAYSAAVVRGGGELVPLSGHTKGLIWVAGNGAELGAVLDAHPQISWVQLPQSGIDAYASVLDRPVRFTSAKGAFAEPVAEHALALTLALLRSFPLRARARSWGPRVGETLFDTTVAIIGGGGIATVLCELLRPFRTRVIVARRTDAAVPGVQQTTTLEGLRSHLPQVDVVIVAAALTAQTRRVVNAEFLTALPEHAVLVNIARGELVDTDALVEALRQGQIAAAGLDVTDPEPLPEGHPLWDLDSVLITPHAADTAEMVQRLLSERIEVNVRGFLTGSDLVGVVDPEAGY